MRKSIEINKKVYTPAEMTFNNVCRLEDLGVSIGDDTKSMSLARAYTALCIGCDEETAGAEIEAHVVAGGKLNDLFDCFREAVEESDFFQALNKTENEDVVAVEKPTKKTSK